jgi:hypothetical protein
MKVFNGVIATSVALVIVAVSSTTHLTSCVKETIHDTTTVVVRDTIIKEIVDTIIQTDTICRLDNGLVAHYNFTDGSLLDETENHNDIIFNNASNAPDSKGTADNAFLFNGNSNYMRVANSSSLNPQNITLMARVKVNDFYQGTCHFSEILGKGYTDITSGFYVLRVADPFGHCYDAPDETKEFFLGGFGNNNPEGAAAGVASDTSFVQKDNWYTVVYTYDGTKSSIYVNGKLKAVQEKTVPFTPNTQDMFIGKNEDPSFPYWFNGVIDEIRIYNRAVTSCEAASLSISNE